MDCPSHRSGILQPEDEGTRALQNAGNHLPIDTVKHPRRLIFSNTSVRTSNFTCAILHWC